MSRRVATGSCSTADGRTRPARRSRTATPIRCRASRSRADRRRPCSWRVCCSRSASGASAAGRSRTSRCSGASMALPATAVSGRDEVVGGSTIMGEQDDAGSARHAERRRRSGNAAVEIGLQVDHPRDGTAVRTRCSAASMAVATSRQRGAGRHGDLGADQQLVRAEVHGAQVDDPLDAGRRRAPASICRSWSGAAASPTSRLFVSTPRITATRISSTPIRQVPMPSQTRLAGDHREPDAEQREHQPDQRGDVLEQHHRQLGRLGVPDEPDQLSLPLNVPRLADRGAQRERLQHDRDQQHDDRPRSGRRAACGCRIFSTPS